MLNKKLLKSKTYRIIYRKIKQIGACNVNDVHKRTLHTVGLHMENVHFFTIDDVTFLRSLHRRLLSMSQADMSQPAFWF